MRTGKLHGVATVTFVVGLTAALTAVLAEASDLSASGSVNAASASQRLRPAAEAPRAPAQSLSIEARWEKVQTTIRPDLVVAMCEAFKRDFPNSRFARAEAILQAGARRALAASRAAQLSLDAIDDPAGDDAYRVHLTYAMRGDGDAAHGIAAMYSQGANGLSRDARRQEQWLYVAAELGRGDASWQLAEIYNRKGLVAEAARLEALARAAGYRVPQRLPSKSQNF